MEQETITQTKEKKQTEKTGVTRAAKAKRQKDILRKLLKNRPYKWNELLEEAVKVYVEKYGDEPTDIPDLKGKFGSNFSLLEEAGEVSFDKATNLCSSASKPSRKSSRTEKAATISATSENMGKEKAPDSAVTSRRGKPKRNSAERTEEKNAEKPDEKISETISAEEEKRSAIESALKKAVEKAAAKKSEKTEKATQEKSAQTAGETAAQNTAASETVAGKNAGKNAEKNAEKTPKKRGGKSVKKGDVTAESTKEKESKAGAAETTAEDKAPSEKKESAAVKQNPAQEDLFTLLSSPKEQDTKKPADKEEKAAERAEKKTAKNELLLTEFAFLGNASKRTETQERQNTGDAAPVAPAAPSMPAAPAAPKKEETAVSEKTPEEKKNGVGIGETIAEEKKNAAPMGVTNAHNTKSRTAQITPNSQNTQNVRGRAAKQSVRGEQNVGNARANRSGVAYALVQNPEDKLKEEFLRRLRSMSGEYFEYYSVYLLERYSLKSGRRLESLRISGGKNDGGIDGEIELTDRFGFRETIYIQAKNWDPTKGVAEKWMIGETLIQQFVGAATCRQSKDGKRNCRGIFMTTSSFTKEAKEILSVLGEKFIGYDGDEVFETAKECSFGLIQVNGVWQLDEKLLSGDKAFFNL